EGCPRWIAAQRVVDAGEILLGRERLGTALGATIRQRSRVPVERLSRVEPELESHDLGELCVTRRARRLRVTERGVECLMLEISDQVGEKGGPTTERGDGFATVDHYGAQKG